MKCLKKLTKLFDLADSQINQKGQVSYDFEMPSLLWFCAKNARSEMSKTHMPACLACGGRFQRFFVEVQGFFRKGDAQQKDSRERKPYASARYAALCGNRADKAALRANPWRHLQNGQKRTWHHRAIGNLPLPTFLQGEMNTRKIHCGVLKPDHAQSMIHNAARFTRRIHARVSAREPCKNARYQHLQPKNAGNCGGRVRACSVVILLGPGVWSVSESPGGSSVGFVPGYVKHDGTNAVYAARIRDWQAMG